LNLISATLGSMHLWSDGRIFVIGPGGAVSAYSDSTGLELWSTASYGASLGGSLVAADHQGQLHLALRTNLLGGLPRIITFDQATGAVLRTRSGDSGINGLIVDEQDNLYFNAVTNELSESPPYRLVSLSPAGVERWAVELLNPDAPEAVLSHELLMRSSTLRHTSDGSELGAPGWSAPFAHSPSALMSQSARYQWVGWSCGDLTDDCPYIDADVVQLAGTPAGHIAPRFRWGNFSSSALSELTEPQLLKGGETLFASVTQFTSEVQLRAVDETGADRFACAVGPVPVYWPAVSSTYAGDTALTQNRWVVVEQPHCSECLHEPAPVLRAYHVPGLSLGTSGWTGRMGNPGRSGTPR
jgi:hypothetical protein